MMAKRQHRQWLRHGVGGSVAWWGWQQQHLATQAAAVAPRGRSQTMARPLPGQSSRGRPRTAARVRVGQLGWRRRALEHGDRTLAANQPETMSCTNFKASIKTKRLLLELNHLHHAQEGISGYQPERNHNTTS